MTTEDAQKVLAIVASQIKKLPKPNSETEEFKKGHSSAIVEAVTHINDLRDKLLKANDTLGNLGIKA
jgi:hypothetical protein